MRYPTALLAAVSLICLTGCTLPADPVWTPDSRSFVFKHADGSILQYSLEKQASRKLVQAPGVDPCGLAVNPEGNQVAVALAGWWPTGRGGGDYGLSTLRRTPKFARDLSNGALKPQKAASAPPRPIGAHLANGF